MKKYILILSLALLLVLSSCSEMIDSMYEPVDPEDTSIIEISVEQGDSASTIAKKLVEADLVASEFAFSQYIHENEIENELQPGNYKLSRSMNLETIINKMTVVGEQREIVSVTIPEGYENREILALLEENGIVKADELATELENGKYDYQFLKNIDRKYQLEGFLFPDTYEFFKDSTPQEVIVKFLDNFASKFTEEDLKKAESLEMSLNDILALASIIEREAVRDDERALISGVFYNRINAGMKLQSCATVQYILEERKELSYDDMAIDSPYNTYVNEGLPPSPIANPGISSIKAALYPEKTDYVFFVAKRDGTYGHYFAVTYEEHLENIEKANKNAE